MTDLDTTIPLCCILHSAFCILHSHRAPLCRGSFTMEKYEWRMENDRAPYDVATLKQHYAELVRMENGE